MKGVVFNLLEEILSQEHGEDLWDDVLASAGLGGAYTSLGSYPDADFFALVSVASRALDTPPEDLVRWFGRQAMPLFAQNYPGLFARYSSARPFVGALNDIIHPEVRKLYPGADVPEFDFDTSRDDVLVMGYHSSRRLCAFAEGLIEGAAAHYGERVSISQPECMNQGHDRCIIEIAFKPA